MAEVCLRVCVSGLAAACSAPHIIQSQLAEVLTTIVYCDYPQKWPTLLEAVMGHLTSNVRAQRALWGREVRQAARFMWCRGVGSSSWPHWGGLGICTSKQQEQRWQGVNLATALIPAWQIIAPIEQWTDTCVIVFPSFQQLGRAANALLASFFHAQQH